MDVRLLCVVLLVYVLLAEAEEDVEKKEDFNCIVEHDLFDIARSAERSIVRIENDRVGCQKENHKVEDVLPSRLLLDHQPLEQGMLIVTPIRQFQPISFCRRRIQLINHCKWTLGLSFSVRGLDNRPLSLSI